MCALRCIMCSPLDVDFHLGLGGPPTPYFGVPQNTAPHVMPHNLAQHLLTLLLQTALAIHLIKKRMVSTITSMSSLGPNALEIRCRNFRIRQCRWDVRAH